MTRRFLLAFVLASLLFHTTELGQTLPPLDQPFFRTSPVYFFKSIAFVAGSDRVEAFDGKLNIFHDITKGDKDLGAGSVGEVGGSNTH